jgi:hypothetical protein
MSNKKAVPFTLYNNRHSSTVSLYLDSWNFFYKQGTSFNTNNLSARKYYPIVYSVDAKVANASAQLA